MRSRRKTRTRMKAVRRTRSRKRRGKRVRRRGRKDYRASTREEEPKTHKGGGTRLPADLLTCANLRPKEASNGRTSGRVGPDSK